MWNEAKSKDSIQFNNFWHNVHRIIQIDESRKNYRVVAVLRSKEAADPEVARSLSGDRASAPLDGEIETEFVRTGGSDEGEGEGGDRGEVNTKLTEEAADEGIEV